MPKKKNKVFAHIAVSEEAKNKFDKMKKASGTSADFLLRQLMNTKKDNKQ